VLEVVRALAGELGLSLTHVMDVAHRKAAERGRFEQGLFLVHAANLEE
jgi:predicted house-cleaning noncanonical NTP pyrophosphatase (MazG superfamily)